MKTWCLYVLICVAPYTTKGLEVTLAGLPANGYVMNPEGGNPQPLNLVCSYTVDPGETASYVGFFRDGTDTANQIVAIQVSDGTPRKFNSYTYRADVTASGSDPSFTLTIGGVTMADEGSYRCRVNTEFNVATVTTDEQILSLLYRPNPPQITRGPEVATGTYRVSCSSDGGRPAPEIKWSR
ncbi:cell surface A33 antigen-like [Lingula anatina]|uniref:Cell surface A33 antigen-like n=1 Tax=Lingula anatina TaxID=7574 RepID=A0A2R2MIS3_LINAN|nr:cell surface A33 antigen-like [Lingula anatina]|eukprot:XP_023930103.1 cell surface A33 antigen-like [Lingula anatina]